MEFLETHKRESDDEDDEAVDDKDLPPLGTRVRRIKKLTGADDTCNLGTVTKRFGNGKTKMSNAFGKQHHCLLLIIYSKYWDTLTHKP